jgi:hypothetical protein
MKKIYTKPYIAVESFQLDAAIAASCSSLGKIPLGFYQETCADESGPGYFGDACGSAFNGTDVTAPGADANDRLCYHGPIEGVHDMYMNS